MYDSRHSISFYSIVLKIRGYGLCSVQLSESGDDHIHLQADFDEDALEVLREEFTYEGSIFLEPISRLKRVISQHLCYIKKSRSLYWQQDYFPNFIFSLKEDNSKFLNEDYLTEILDIDNFVKLYMFSVDVKSKRFDIDVCANKSHIMLRVKSERDIVEIAEDSKYFRLLTDLQILNIEKGPITVKKSLELEIFILKLFPRHFMTINNV